MSASPVLSVPCLPSCVSLIGGVRLSKLVCALFSFMCLPACVSLQLFPFMCLPEWWCPPLRSCLCLVSLHLSPFMCLPEWWCPPRRSCLCLISLHLSPIIMCLHEWWYCLWYSPVLPMVLWYSPVLHSGTLQYCPWCSPVLPLVLSSTASGIIAIPGSFPSLHSCQWLEISNQPKSSIKN